MLWIAFISIVVVAIIMAVVVVLAYRKGYNDATYEAGRKYMKRAMWKTYD